MKGHKSVHYAVAPTLNSAYLEYTVYLPFLTSHTQIWVALRAKWSHVLFLKGKLVKYNKGENV